MNFLFKTLKSHMKMAVSEAGVVFGRVMVVEDGGRGVQNFANVIIGVRTSDKVQFFAEVVPFA